MTASARVTMVDTTKTARVRKAITAADFDWTEYHKQLNRAKTASYTR